MPTPWTASRHLEFPIPPPPLLYRATVSTGAPRTEGFQLALTMAGAVSAGAYTAGVMDFFIEALDAWYEQVAKEVSLAPKERTVPWHKVQLRAVSGASAGSMCGAILALAIHRRFPHVRAHSKPEVQKANPFYQAWVNRIDISALLGTRDLESSGGPVVSLLDCTSLQEILNEVMDSAQAIGGPVRRDWVNEQVTFRFTVTNLDPLLIGSSMNGIGAPGHLMWFHQAHASFCLSHVDPGTGSSVWLDSTLIHQPSNPITSAAWNAFGQAALASGGFPFFLRGRQVDIDLHASLDAVLPRQLRVRRENGSFCIKASPPEDANKLPTGPTRVFTVDGGALNNEPLELARRDLLGPAQLRNPRSGLRANSAVVMVAPFPNLDGPLTRLQPQTPVQKLLAPFLATWAHHARFRPDEIALAEDESIYSRFILAPERTGGPDAMAGRGPLASGALGAFMGFFSRAYRHHDFLLGRRNAQQFLRSHFCLPAANPLFRGMDHLHGAWALRQHGGIQHLPLVPLVGVCATEESLPLWPLNTFSPEDLRPLLKQRVRGLIQSFASASTLGWRIVLHISEGVASWLITKEAVKAMRRAICDAGL